jgi:hypothetical protein
MDWKATLLDPIYSALGVPAVLVLASTDASYTGLTVIDKTTGIEVGGGGDLGISTIKPACAIRIADITANGIDLIDLKGSTIAFNGKAWRIEHRVPRPLPSGESEGELLLILTEIDENDV